MLNRLDDYPIHQTPDPLAHPASSDHNVYDRTWFNGYRTDGSAFFGIGMAVYPHKGIIDAAFSTVRAGGLQHAFFASGRMPTERTDMSVGPMRIEIVEPMRTMRVIIDENDTGVSADLTFSTRTAPIEEAHQTLWTGTRKSMDATRFDQFGRWSGTIVDPDGEMTVDEQSWRGTKDRSWGIRSLGPQAPAAPGGLPQLFFLWAPLHWDDHISHAIFFDGPEGQPLVREALTAPLFDTTAAVSDGPTESRMAGVVHDVRYHPGTRLAESATISMTGIDGSVRRIELTPILRFQMKGLGYLHPVWNQGTWHGEEATGYDSFDPATLDLTAFENLHVQQVVQASDGERTGVGVLEQIAIGPYGPAGFTSLNDGA